MAEVKGAIPKAIAKPPLAQVQIDRAIALIGRRFLNALSGLGIATAIIEALRATPTALPYESELSDTMRDQLERDPNAMRLDPQVVTAKRLGPNKVVLQYAHAVKPDAFVPAVKVGIAQEIPAIPAVAGAPPILAPRNVPLAPPVGAFPVLRPVRVTINIAEKAVGPRVEVKTQPVSAAAVNNPPIGPEAKARTFRYWMAFNQLVTATYGRISEIQDAIDVLISNTYAKLPNGRIVNASLVERGSSAGVLQGILDGEYKVDLEGFLAGMILENLGDALIAKFNQYGMKGLRQAGYSLPVGVNSLMTAVKRLDQISEGGLSNADISRGMGAINFTATGLEVSTPTQSQLRALW